MAIRVLLDHGVNEDHIIFVTFLVARAGGVSILRTAFPKVKIVCSGVDEEMQEGWLEGYKGEGNPEGLGRQVWIMKPGMGQIGSLMLLLIFLWNLMSFPQGDRYYI
jgi:uridine kinase